MKQKILEMISTEKIKALVKGMALCALGVVLLIVFRQIDGGTKTVYYPELGVDGIPYNIGFQWSAIPVALSVLLIQSGLFVLVSKKREWKFFTWTVGLWLLNIGAYDAITVHSRIFYELRLRDFGYDFGYSFISFWNFMGAGLLIVGLAFFWIFVWGWLEGDDEDGQQGNGKALTVLRAVGCALGAILLILRCITNVWYIILCVVTCLIAWVLLAPEKSDEN